MNLEFPTAVVCASIEGMDLYATQRLSPLLKPSPSYFCGRGDPGIHAGIKAFVPDGSRVQESDLTGILALIIVRRHPSPGRWVKRE